MPCDAKMAGGFEGADRLDAGTDDAQVAAFAEQVAAADLESMVAREDDGAGIAGQPQIRWAWDFHHRAHCGAEFVGIGGRDGDDAGHGAKDGDVLDRLMGLCRSCRSGCRYSHRRV